MKKLKFKKAASYKRQAPSLTACPRDDRINIMKEINYKNKKIKLPFPDADYSDQPFEMEEVKNPFSGQSIQLPEFAAIIYDTVIDLNLKAERKDWMTYQPPGISEHQDDWQKVRDGINFFRQYFAKEYMVLLDL